MKVAIPVIDKENSRSHIAPGFNSTGYLCIYDNESNDTCWLKISEMADNMGDLLPAMQEKRINNVITKHIQPMALQVLTNKGFVVYRSNGDNLDENLKAFDQGVLLHFDMAGAMETAKVCGGACDLCNTPDDCTDKTD